MDPESGDRLVRPHPATQRLPRSGLPRRTQCDSESAVDPVLVWGDVWYEQWHSRNVYGSDHATACRDAKMFDKCARIAVRGHDRQLAVGRGYRERRHPAWHRLHDVVQHDLADGGKT